jgi:hypothetical protein
MINAIVEYVFMPLLVVASVASMIIMVGFLTLILLTPIG